MIHDFQAGAGPIDPAAPQRDPPTVGNDLIVTTNTARTSHLRAYPVRWLKQRYGLTRSYAAVVAAEFGWGEIS